MKKIVFILSLIVLPLAISAQHYVGVSADVTTACQLDQIDQTRFSSGGGGQIGFTYEFQRNMFILNTGLAVGYTASAQILDSVNGKMPMFDSEGRPFELQYKIDERHDIAKQLHFKLPLLMGLQGGHFYGLIGFVFDYTLPAWTVQTAKLYTAGDYNDRYYDILENMPNHGYHDFERIKSKGKLKYKPDFRISAELGAQFLLGNRTRKPKAKLGLFFEYGLTDANSEEIINNKLYEYNTDQFLQVNMSHIYTTNLVYGSRINNLEVGIRGTILFNVGGIEPNGGCNCHRRLL